MARKKKEDNLTPEERKAEKQGKWLIILLFVIIVAAGTMIIYFTTQNAVQKSVGELDFYQAAMNDAVFADPEELESLVGINTTSNYVTWNEAQDKVLLISWHNAPDSFPAGETITTNFGELWTFTDKEIRSWYPENSQKVEDWSLRLSQLLGLPEDMGYTHFSAFWVSPDDLIRPAYQPDVTKQMTTDILDGSALGEYEEWFEETIMSSYFDNRLPWTRLGYTYDWANTPSEYGLSEFLVLPDSEVAVEWTLTTDEFVQWLAN